METPAKFWMKLILMLFLVAFLGVISLDVDRLTSDEIPNFFIIGTAKSGTTSLNDLLMTHPEICENEAKEKHYFDRNISFAQGSQFYRRMFETKTSGCKYLIDSTPAYMRAPDVPSRMAAYYSAAALQRKKLIVILREPASRECSWYQHYVRGCVVHINKYMHVNMPNRDGTWDVNSMCQDPHGYCDGLGCRKRLMGAKSRFVEKLFSFDDKYSNGRVFASDSFYDEQLSRFLKVFKRNQIFMISFDDLISNPKAIIQQLTLFLGLKGEFSSATLPASNVNRVNVSCTCATLEKLRAIHNNRGTLQKTMDIVNDAARHKTEPEFTPFRVSTKSCVS